jgi:hypothetical protein
VDAEIEPPLLSSCFSLGPVGGHIHSRSFRPQHEVTTSLSLPKPFRVNKNLTNHTSISNMEMTIFNHHRILDTVRAGSTRLVTSSPNLLTLSEPDPRPSPLLTFTRALNNAETLTIFLGTPGIVFAGLAARPGRWLVEVPNKQTIRCIGIAIGKWHQRDGLETLNERLVLLAHARGLMLLVLSYLLLATLMRRRIVLVRN